MDDIEDRLAAVERAVTGGDASVEELRETAAREAALADVREAVAELDDRVARLEAATRALRGYAGGVRAVDESVERRADLALARIERLEERLGAASDVTDRGARSPPPEPTAPAPERATADPDATADGGGRGPLAPGASVPADAADALAVAGGATDRSGADGRTGADDREGASDPGANSASDDADDRLRERFAARLRRAL